MRGSSSTSAAAAPLLRRRLLRDIAELSTAPHYPNIRLHADADGPDGLKEACLVLTTDAYAQQPLHLTMRFLKDYPVSPPQVLMDTPGIEHPNVFGSYICASILNTAEGYTSAYTLKAIAIQLLSFFSSDSVEQVTGTVVQLGQFRDTRERLRRERQRRFSDTGADAPEQARFCCGRCGYDNTDPKSMHKAAGVEEGAESDVGGGDVVMADSPPADDRLGGALPPSAAAAARSIDVLADDVVLLVLQQLDAEGLQAFAAASERVRRLVERHDVLRQRELQCFCLKTSYMKSDLGVGVATRPRYRGASQTLQSEFDLLSREAFATLHVRRSVQGLPFDHWLPLPLSRRHWLRVRGDVAKALQEIGAAVLSAKKKPHQPRETPQQNAPSRRQHRAGRGGGTQQCPASPPADMPQATEALFSLMVQIVVRLNGDVEKLSGGSSDKSTLRHASEKAIESYFHLFHLLVCLAAEHPQLAADANRRIRSFYVDNRRSKADCPNLGMLLVALLIADDSATAVSQSSPGSDGKEGTREDLLKAIITEAITRNVVWLLDGRGAGRAELVHMEPDGIVSEYRLHHTFVGSLTSYRLLMFMELFRRTARQPAAGGEATLEAIRDGLFQRHGAPPPGAASSLAAEVRRLQAIRNWPDFLEAMGVTAPSKAVFCDVLRRAVRQSMSCGYSKWVLSAAEAKSLREYHETMSAAGLRHHADNLLRGSGRGHPGVGVVRRQGGLPDEEAYRYQCIPRPTAEGPWQKVLSAQEVDMAMRVRRRLQLKESTFFPEK